MLVQSESAVVVRFSAARSTCGRWFQCGQQIQWSLILVRSARTMVVLLSLSGQATSVLPNCSDFSVRENARTLTWSLSTGCWLIGKLEDDYWDFRKSVLLRWVSKYYTAQPVKTVVFQFRLSQQLYSVFVLFCCFFVLFFFGGSVQLASTVVFGFRAARKHCGLWF